MSVSILMPLYNCAQFLKDSLTSIIKQTYQDFEIIIVDNYSTDDPLSIIDEIGDSRIKYYKYAKSNLSNSLNFGLSKCTFEIVARFDADDLMVNERLEKQLSVFNLGKKNLILSSWYGIYVGNKVLYTIKTSVNNETIRKRLALHSEIIHSGVMFNKTFIIEKGGYDPEIRIEDYEMWLRLNYEAEFRNIPEILSLVRFRDTSTSWSNLEIKNKEIYSYQEKYFNEASLSGLGYKSEKERNDLKGWREFFYGKKELARDYWKISGTPFRVKYIVASLITRLPERTFVYIKELRLRFRLIYLLNYFSSENRKVRSDLNKLVKS
ncbi:glycosyltransferase family 2 protein [soil metagenome]